MGFVVGATGVGGGSLMTPLLTLVFNVPAQIAVGTDLLFAAITKSGGVLAHTRRGNVHWAITGWLVAGSVPAALATLSAVSLLKPDAAALAQIMTRTLAVALLLTALGLVFKAQIQALGRRVAAGGVGTAQAVGAGPVVIALPVPASVQLADADGRTAARPLPTLCVGVLIGTLVA